TRQLKKSLRRGTAGIRGDFGATERKANPPPMPREHRGPASHPNGRIPAGFPEGGLRLSPLLRSQRAILPAPRRDPSRNPNMHLSIIPRSVSGEKNEQGKSR